MVREIVHDPMLLALRSGDASAEDLRTAADLRDTLRAHADECVGMAANMIGVRKRIIAVSVGPLQLIMLNPVILRKSGMFTAEESCLSLRGGPRKVTRYREIEVEYLDERMRVKRAVYTGWTAQIIQHETDHCDGVLI